MRGAFARLTFVLPALLAATSLADARTETNGRTWRLVEARVTATVASWGSDCGPRPEDENPTTNVTYLEGDDGALTGGPGARRLFDPRACAALTQQPDLRIHRGADTWQCETPPGAGKRAEAKLTRRTLGPGTLRIEHHVHYDWVLKGSHCEVTLAGRYDLEDPEAVPPAPTSDPGPDCTSPGGLASLEAVGSARRVLPLGGRVRLSVRAADARGCALDGLPSWTFTAGRVSPEGEFDARGVAAGESVVVTASRENLSVVFSLRVASDAADFAALTVAEPQLAEGTLPALAPQRGEAISGAAVGDADPNAQFRARLLMGAFVSLLALLTAGGIWIALRPFRKRRNRTDEVLNAQALDVLARSARARAARDTAPGAPDAGERVCPKCGARYGAGTDFCGQDGARLQGLN